MMTFGPISIRPDLQRQGLGKYLLDYSMEKAKELGAGVLCIESGGGFLRQIRICLGRDPWNPLPRRAGAGTGAVFPAQRASPGVSGRCHRGLSHTPRYYVDEAAAEAFDQSFPPKEN